MDYEQKYKEAQKWIESIYSELSHEQQMEAEAFFPELKESEDERIRKTLLRFHKSTIDIDGIKGDDILAWLEKQGKQPSAIRWYDVSLIPQEMEELLVEWDSEDATWHEIAFYHADTKTFWNSTRQVENVTRWCYIIDLLEKQGEQKTSVLDFKAEDWCVSKVDGKIHNIYNSVAKVEPKFKVGDWVIYMGTTAKILDLQKHCYVGKDTNDKDFVVSYCNEYAMKKWDISYAKDGDVLASDNSIFIFQEEYIAEKPIAYCGLMNGRFLVDGEDACWANEKCYPATKEQCNTLFAKMKEAGYEWNEETHELKKIEDEEYNGEDYGIDGLWHAQRILEKTLGKVEGYQTDDGFLSHQCAITAVKKLYKQKPAWSEEDKDVLEDIEEAIINYWHGDTQGIILEWLKSIKDRVQPKPKQEWKQENIEELTEFENAMMHIGGSFFGDNAGLDPNDTNVIKEQAKLLLKLVPKTEWSEEDEDAIGMAIIALGDMYDPDDPDNTYVGYSMPFNKAVERLKSLKQRIGWKPSDEQMRALHDLNLTGNISYAGQGQVLIELYNDLKKLAG